MSDYTINDIQAAVRAAGSHWFDPDAMRMFGTRVLNGTVYNGENGVYFVTSEWDGFDGKENNRRAWTVRRFVPETADINTIGHVCQYRTADQAKQVAEKLCGKGRAVRDQHRLITEAEQFLHNLKNHGCPLVTSVHARSLMVNAAKHHRACEHQCNGDERGDSMRRQAERSISATCRKIGCGVVFSGDPRGSTVKLVMPDGHTDDWGQEGLCVPLSNRE